MGAAGPRGVADVNTFESPAPIGSRPVDRVGVYGHRGASSTLPENTLSAFERALDDGAEGIELDVALSADGIPVVMHDHSIDRTTDGTGNVDALTLEQLRAVDAGDGQRIPTLDEVLALAVRYGAEVNIEMKAADAAAPVLAVTRAHPGLAWFASSFHWEALRELRELDADARIYPLTLGVADLDRLRKDAVASGYPVESVEAEIARLALSGGLSEAILFATSVAAEGVSVWEAQLEATDIARIHDAGLLAWVWTINDPARAEQIIAAGADAVCTDDPGAIIAFRARLAG